MEASEPNEDAALMAEWLEDIDKYDCSDEEKEEDDDYRTEYCKEIDEKLNEPILTVVRRGSIGDMDEQEQKRCREVLGYFPPNIVEGRFAALLAQKRPHFKKALDMAILKDAVMSINESSQVVCAALMLIKYSGGLVKQTLARMGRNAEGRDGLIQLALVMNQEMENLHNNVDNFVSNLQIISRDVGAASTIIEYGAAVEGVTEIIEGVQARIKQEAEKATRSMSQAKEPIKNVLRFILQNLHDIDGHCKEIEARKKEWEECVQDFSAHFQAIQEKKKPHEQELLHLGLEKERLTSEIKHLRYRERIKTQELSETARRNQSIEEQLENVVQDETSESKLDIELILEDQQKKIEEEVLEKKKEMDARIQRKRDERATVLQKAKDYEEQSKNASDGRASSPHNAEYVFLLLFSGRMSGTESIQVGPDEKAEYRELAKLYFGQAHELEQEIVLLEREKDAELAKFRHNMVTMTKRENQIQRNDEHKKRVMQLNLVEKTRVLLQRNLGYFKRKAELLEEEREEIRNCTAEAEHKLRSVEAKMTPHEQALKEIDTIDGRVLEEKKENMESLHKRYQELQKRMYEDFNKFDLQNDTQFVALMKVLGLLVTSIDHLPIGMKMMSTAFDKVYTSLDSDMFSTMLAKIPPSGQRRYLEDLLIRLQSVCQVGYTLLQIPMKKLLSNTVKELVDEERKLRRASLLPRVESSVSIEEVEDAEDAEDGGPPHVEVEEQEHDGRNRQHSVIKPR